MQKQSDLIAHLNHIFPEVNLSQWDSFTAMTILPQSMLPVAEKLRNHPDLQFDMLVCLTAVDRVNMLKVIYHLRSTQKGYDLIVKTELTDPNLELPSVAAQWKSAELFELEVYDMFGIVFKGHPDLRRLFMPEDWEGFPLRKNYKQADAADNYLKSHQLLINQQ